jgi:hypothetical protein
MTARAPGRPSIAVVTVSLDLHALAVRHELEERLGVGCSIVETDRLPGRGALSWSNDEGFPTVLPTDRAGTVTVEELDVIWWRRANTPPAVPPEVTDGAHRDLVRNDCQASLLGVLLSRFRGTWVSDPEATRRAENKLVQLEAARACGLRTPRTLVSQDPGTIRRFCGGLGNRVVVKPVRGTRERPPLTAMLDERLLSEDAAMALAPAIYQEYVAGNRHLRAHVLGDRVLAAELESEAVDWRADMNIPVRPAELSPGLERRLCAVVRHLGLAMGVVDLKVDGHGEPVWLEVNPQGQFLFVEGLAGLPLTRALAEFLAAQSPV